MKSNKKLRSGFLLAALGMIYGDIATSPLYVLGYIVRESGGARAVSEELVLGALSLILWSLLLLATGKGVALLLRADNRGEGGHFALYALVRDRGRWLLFPAALGGAALLADSFLTPALTLTAAVEGSRSLAPGAFAGPGDRAVVLLVIALLSVLFLSQGLGSRRTGRFLGPVMLCWLLFIGVTGAMQLPGAGAVLRALDPRLGLRFLFTRGNPIGFALLGLVFLSVTGTEILYANLDFGGRRAITRAWPFVLLCLCLSYLGQGAWLLRSLGGPAPAAGAADPFFGMLPGALRLPALILALAAAWGASQTVVNGSFTLVSEAIRLDLLPPLEIRYPSDSIRQEYIPAVNFLMWLLSCGAVVLFRSGQRMAAVYGLTIAVSMLTTSVLLFVHIRAKRPRAWPVLGAVAVFGVLETAFLIAGLEKLRTGGVVTVLLTLLLLAAMLSWNRGEEIERRFSTRAPLRASLSRLEALRADGNFGRLADNLVYIDNGDDPETVDRAILFSLLDRGPKRARAYWFVTVNTVADPNCQRYRVETFGTDFVFRVRMDLGYKCSRPLTRYLRDVFLDMERQGLAPIRRKSYCISEESALGSFHYCVLRRRVSGAEALTTPELWALRMRNLLQELAGLREEWYTEADTDVEVERIPLSLDEESPAVRLQRLFGPRTTPIHRKKNEQKGGMTVKDKIIAFFLGRRLEDTELSEEKFNVLWGIPIFASDAISSVSYAGEEVLLVLVPVLAMGAFRAFLPIVAAIICLLGILVFCYRQTIEAYPEGGGAYIVASDNLGEKVGLIAGGSLIMDYILTVAVSSCAGAAAITSAFPSMLPYKALLAFAIICLLTWGNLRGIRESSVMFGVPTYLFILTMLSMIVTGIVKYSMGLVTPAHEAVMAANSAEIATDAMVILVLKAFASGCTALTGVEAVSNGVPNFKAPAPQHAKKVLLAMAGFVCIIFFGVSLLISLYKILPAEDATTVSMLAAAVFGKGSAMFYVVQVMTVVILSLAANTAFADLPLLMSLIAGHGYLPKQLVNRGSRLNFSNGIFFLFGMASLLVFIFRGSQHLLLPLYASGVFISFFLNQFGMFTHWRKNRGPHWKFKAAVNGFGSVLTGTVLIIIVVMKFMRGAWVALLLIASFILIMLRIKKHYEKVSADLTISSGERALAEINRDKTARVIIPVQSLNKSFIKTVNCALSCGFTSMELYSVCSTEEQARKIKEQIDTLGLGCEFRYDVTTLRNTSEILLAHIRQEADALENERLIVMMGGLVVTSPFAKILHNSTTHRLMRKMETYRNVYVFSVPYVIE